MFSSWVMSKFSFPMQSNVLAWLGAIAMLAAVAGQAGAGAVGPANQWHAQTAPGGDTTQRKTDGGLMVLAAVTDEDPGGNAEAEPAAKIGNCAGAYHSALSRIDATSGEALTQAVEAVKSGWRKLTGRWLFPPGRGAKDKTFRMVVRHATRLVRHRGIDSKLKRTMQTQLVGRLAGDLKVYVGQRAAPALCTGAPQYMDFFDGQLTSFRRDQEKAARLFERAAQIADWTLIDAHRALNAPLERSDGNDMDVLAKLFETARTTWSTIVDADDTPGLLYAHVSALAHSRAALMRLAIKRRDPLRARYAEVYAAFTAIEALAYLQASHANHHAITAGFGNTISAVRSAYARNCVCSN